MSDSDISPFLLSVKRTEVRYSLLAAFPWTIFEYPNLNSRVPNVLYGGYDLETVTAAMADHHGYTGNDRAEYIARLIEAGNASRAQWDSIDPAPPGNFERAIQTILQASTHRPGYPPVDYGRGRQSWWHNIHRGAPGMSGTAAFMLVASVVAIALIYHFTR
jgi:hypothetical protein